MQFFFLFTLDLFLSSFAQECMVIYDLDSMSHVRYITSLYPTIHTQRTDSHDTGNSMPYSLTIIPQAQMGYESIAHEAEGRIGY